MFKDSHLFLLFKIPGETTASYGTKAYSGTSRKTIGERTINGKTQWSTRYNDKMILPYIVQIASYITSPSYLYISSESLFSGLIFHMLKFYFATLRPLKKFYPPYDQ